MYIYIHITTDHDKEIPRQEDRQTAAKGRLWNISFPVKNPIKTIRNSWHYSLNWCRQRIASRRIASHRNATQRNAHWIAMPFNEITTEPLLLFCVYIYDYYRQTLDDGLVSGYYFFYVANVTVPWIFALQANSVFHIPIRIRIFRPTFKRPAMGKSWTRLLTLLAR